LTALAAALVLLAGMLFGALAGILPGLHSNTLNSIVLALNLPLDGNSLALLIAAMACARLAFEAIPAILLFIPDENTVLAMLPGHRLALEGKAAPALRIFAFSTLASAAIALVLLLPALFVIPVAYSFLHPYTPIILAAACIVMVSSERGAGRLAAALSLLLAGVLGLIALNSSLNDPFLPAFTGLFAVPAAFFALKSKANALPKTQQKQAFDPTPFLPLILLGTLLGAFADLFPGMGSAAKIALFASFLVPLDSERFLSLAASISSSHLLFSFAALSSIGKARTGAAAAVSSVLGDVGSSELLLLAGAALISISASSALVFLSSGRIAKEFGRLDHRAINLVMLAFIPLLVLCLEGLQGLAVLAAASLIGALPIISGTKRITLMGFILIPALAQSII